MNYLMSFQNVLVQEADALRFASQKVNNDQLTKLTYAFDWLKNTGGSLVFSGVGKSGLIAQKIAATFSSLGLSSFFLHPTEALHGDLGRLTKADVLVIMSKSGTTDELVQLLKFISLPKTQIIGLLGNLHSPLAELTHLNFDVSVEKEACLNDLAPTTSTTLMLAMGDAMAVVFEAHCGVSKEAFALNHPAGLLGKSLSLKVDKLMIPLSECAVVKSDAVLKDALLQMASYPVGMCAVCEGKNIIGIIVEGDVRRAFTQNSEAINQPVTDVMNKIYNSILPTTLAFEALKLMEDRKKPISVLPIVENQELIGVLRLHDLFKAGFFLNQSK